MNNENPEHIRSILKRVFHQLEIDWKRQEEREEIEGKNQEHNTHIGQI